jgi:hypothetical protein
MSIAISVELLPKIERFGRNMVIEEDNYNLGNSIEFKSQYEGGFSHDMFNHPVATLVMNEILPNEKISSFSHRGESFVHGFQGVAWRNFNRLDENGIYKLKYLISYLNVNCKDVLPMSLQGIEQVVEFYYYGYFSGKDYISIQSLAKLRQDLLITRNNLNNVTESILFESDDKNIKYGITYLDIAELKFLDKDKIYLQVKNAMDKTRQVIQSVFDSQ